MRQFAGIEWLRDRLERRVFSKILLAVLMVPVAMACQAVSSTAPDLVQKNFEIADKQLSLALDELGSSHLSPRSINEDGTLLLVKSSDWTSGFFPGSLWYMYEYSRDKRWLDAAQVFTNNMAAEQFNDVTHDMGFKMLCSYGNGFRLTENPDYKRILLQSAKTLITRFNPNVGCIRSWDHHEHLWQFPVIIDNMMNLELLFWATKASGDSTFYNIAVTHANTTMKNHFRADFSTWHVIDYDSTTGVVRDRNTHQGFSHESTWSRGQAWGLYGFTMCYRETGDPRFLGQAQRIADFILSHNDFPADKVPYWDFAAPDIPEAKRDASAAAIICAAFYELSTFTKEGEVDYRAIADEILTSLSSSTYLAEPGANKHFLLKHAVGNLPADSEVDVPLVYADYYFLEANLRKMRIDVPGSMGTATSE